LQLLHYILINADKPNKHQHCTCHDWNSRFILQFTGWQRERPRLRFSEWCEQKSSHKTFSFSLTFLTTCKCTLLVIAQRLMDISFPCALVYMRTFFSRMWFIIKNCFFYIVKKIFSERKISSASCWKIFQDRGQW
jgi:hypothetical protein